MLAIQYTGIPARAYKRFIVLREDARLNHLMILLDTQAPHKVYRGVVRGGCVGGAKTVADISESFLMSFYRCG
jgi:hypothetical protein